MNVYEEAHNLSRAIKLSNEYKELHDIKEVIKDDAELNEMINNFNKMQVEMQAKIISEEINQSEMMSQMQGVMTMLQGKPIAIKYIEAQARFSMMMKDVYEIISKAIDFNPNELFNS